MTTPTVSESPQVVSTTYPVVSGPYILGRTPFIMRHYPSIESAYLLGDYAVGIPEPIINIAVFGIDPKHVDPLHARLEMAFHHKVNLLVSPSDAD
jgi:hypothetical protein